MKIKILSEYSKNLNYEDVKSILEILGYKGNFSFKSFQKEGIFELKIKEKINKDLKNLIPFFIKGEAYKESLTKKSIFFKVFLIGVDSIVLPKEGIELENLLKLNEIIPYSGLKEGIEAYLKFKKAEDIKYLLINNIKQKNAKKFLISFLTCLIKNYPVFSFEIENKEPFTYYFLSFKGNNGFFPLKSFGNFLENFGRTIYVEKVLSNGL